MIAAPPLPAVPVAHPQIEVGRMIAGHEPDELARVYGTPVFIYDLDVVAARVAALRGALPPGVDLAYAVKANPSPAVLRHMARLGRGADVASGGELEAVIRAGFDVRRIVFTGPGKTDTEIGRAIRLGIRALTIESLEELEVVLQLAPLAGPRQGLLLRLAVDDTGERTRIISGTGASKFGLLPDEVEEALDRLHLAGVIDGPGTPYELLGLHAFGASNVLDAAQLASGVRRLADTAEQIVGRHGIRLPLLDAGGGLGIPYRDGEDPLDLHELGDLIARELGTWSDRPGLAGTRLLLEPGRFLVGPAGAYLMRVVRTKPRGDRTITITDGGIHHLSRPALIGQQQRIVAVGAAAGRLNTATADVVGPLCTGLDTLGIGVSLPEPRTGDFLVVRDAGAYGFTESMPLFLSHPIPAELAVEGGVARVARLRVEPRSDWP
jgi:diaminopimelate decarboxylase